MIAKSASYVIGGDVTAAEARDDATHRV